MKGLDDTVSKAAKSTKGSLDFITSGLKSMAQGFVVGAITAGVMEAVAGFRDMADKAQVLRARLAQVVGGVDEASKAFLRITQISVNHGQSMDAIGTLYEKIARNATNLGVTQQGVAAITNSFAASLRLSGAGAQQAEAAILQFSQALASGRLQGDEYRSMTENNSVFMVELAKAAGTTLGGLKKLSSEGKIDLEFLRNAMFKVGDDGKTMLDKLDEGAAKLPMTFKQAKEQVATQLTNLVDALVNTANNSESIFTTMAKKVANVFGAMAAEFRIFSEGRAAEAAFRAGKAVPDDDLSLEQKAVRKQVDILANLRDEINQKRAGLAKGAANPTGMLAIDAQASSLRRQAEKELGALEARANGMASAIGKVNASMAEMAKKPSLAQLISGDPVKTPGKDKKEKKGSTAEDVLVQFQQDLKVKDMNLDNKLAGMGINEQKLEKAIAESKLNKKRIDEIAAATRPLAQEMDKELERNKYGKELADNMTKAYEAQVKFDKKRVEGLVAEGEARFKKTDPLMQFYDKIVEIDEAINMINGKEMPGSPEQLEQLREYRSNMNETTEAMGKFGEKGKTVAQEIAEAMQNSSKDMADAILDFVSGTETSFGKMALNIIKSIASIQLQKMLDPYVKAGSDWLTSIISPGAVKQAKGGGWDKGVQFFADGGVFNSPTAFGHAGGLGVLGEAGPEAVMPLQRDGNGKLGVSTAPVSIEIINMSGGEVEQSEGTDENGNKKIMVMIHKVVNEGINGGQFDRSMNSTYGVKRKGQ